MSNERRKKSLTLPKARKKKYKVVLKNENQPPRIIVEKAYDNPKRGKRVIQ